MGIQAKAAAASNFSNKEIYLVADMENVGEWTPIATMAGTFDGQGHMISGFDNDSSAIYGMFKAVTGKVGNFTLSDSVIRTNSYSGSIVGTLSGELYDVHVDESVTVKGNVTEVYQTMYDYDSLLLWLEPIEVDATDGAVGTIVDAIADKVDRDRGRRYQYPFRILCRCNAGSEY